jgi:hypothetical protein
MDAYVRVIYVFGHATSSTFSMMVSIRFSGIDKTTIDGNPSRFHSGYGSMPAKRETYRLITVP